MNSGSNVFLFYLMCKERLKELYILECFDIKLNCFVIKLNGTSSDASKLIKSSNSGSNLL